MLDKTFSILFTGDMIYICMIKVKFRKKNTYFPLCLNGGLWLLFYNLPPMLFYFIR